MRRSLMVIGLVALCAQVTGMPVAGAEPDDTDASALAFREEFGLDTSPSTMRAVAMDPMADREYGVPLAQDEVTELQRRAGIQLNLAKAIDIAREDAQFAGVYIDQLAKGEPVFLFAGVGTVDTSALANAMPEDASFRVERVRYTVGELAEVQERVDADLETLRRAGIELTGTGLDLRANRVVVQVARADADQASWLKSAYGEELVIEEDGPAVLDSCTAPDDCYPVKGGLFIDSAEHPSTDCTAGFVVRRTANDAQLSVVTAGHCLEAARLSQPGGVGTVNDDWRHHGTAFGDAKYETYPTTVGTTSNADVGIIGIKDAFIADMPSFNQLALRADPGDPMVIRYVTGALASDYQYQGMQLCRYGITSASTCGTITLINATKPSCRQGQTDCRSIKKLWVWSKDSLGGDSGGPVYVIESSSERTALGTHVHSSDETTVPAADRRSWYSPVDIGIETYDAMHDDLFHICTDYNC